MDRVGQLNELLREHCCVISVGIEFQAFKYDLTLKMSADESDLDTVTILFQDVSVLQLNGFGGGLTQFMDLKVTRINDGLDRVRYELRDIGDEKISFSFFTFSGPIIEE
ncbi:hypothetical protein C4K35_4695 [Pseudomonas chlororaphis subsp. piscium]|uniref:hypothetical protein n=1 Tax=Pseudomonas chlororaphis TaxID=587753 RepID=UPI000F58A2C8|nr:hypothetical protein [Pseudomonas chlororaphis]AZC52264.1 hypothetical protein C4K35_4695 [Pseudomonas chlororaphis subsp. piscium]